MTLAPPPVDGRTFDDLLAQIGKNVGNAGFPDSGPGVALEAAVARLAEIVVERLNAAPEKNRAAFLDLVGVALAPPQPARVPLTFSLAPGATGTVRVPAGTTVTGNPGPGGSKPPAYTTDRELVLTTAKLIAAWTRNGDDTIGNEMNWAPALVGGTAVVEPFFAPAVAGITVADPLLQTAGSATIKVGPTTLPPPTLPVPLSSVNGVTAAWASLDATGLAPPLSAPTVEVTLPGTSIAPDALVVDGVQVDPAQACSPFGQPPEVGASFYVACSEALSPGNTVTLTLAATIAAGATTSVEWSYWNGTAWTWLEGGPDLHTNATWEPWGKNPVPQDLESVTVAGRSDRWLRAVLTASTPPTDRTQPFGPVVTSLKISLTGSEGPHSVERVLTSSALQPHDVSPALYLGFDAPFGNVPTTLYFGIEDERYDSGSKTPAPSSADLAWECWNGSQWTALVVSDETEGLAHRGLVTFIGPADQVSWSPFDFGVDAYWLRIRWCGGDGAAARPGLTRILTNTVWAENAQVVELEVLGSSTGEPSQAFTVSRPPVLEGQLVEVLEADQAWHAWEEAVDFAASGPFSRHYVLERGTGEIRFGDGAHGRVPPPNRASVRASYRTGGGESGNCDAGEITKLTTAVPSVASVTNTEPAAGGSALETLAAALSRGPSTLRNGGRSVAASDFEDLAAEASTDVARAHAVAAGDPTAAGQVRVVVVPESSDRKPVPSVALLEEIHAYVGARMSPTVDLWVTGPLWGEVDVTAVVVPVSLVAGADVQAAVQAALDRFLHPITGGRGGGGWMLGQIPPRAELIAVAAAVPGVDHVHQLDLDITAGLDAIDRLDELLVYSGTHTIGLLDSS